MSTDQSLKQAVANLETAWRRLREVLDGPDVAAALVERPRPMSTAPRDGTVVRIHLADGRNYPMEWDPNSWLWWDDCQVGYGDESAKGWSPVK